jgi:hypothetical protein
MIKIAHEAPLCIMKDVREMTDYCYALVHLFEECQEYYDYFIESKSLGREVLLDNSIFELGVAFNSDKFAEWITKLQPTEYIVPDVLEDSSATMNSFEKFIEKYKDLPGKKIGVVQGKTYKELYDCYSFMSNKADKIAISFDYSYYLTTGLGKNKYQQYCNGRYKLINDLISDNIINLNKPHHLLGCSLPAEFGFYGSWPKTYKFIQTLDTSNPVVNGMHNIKYETYGVRDKLSTKLIDVFYVKNIKEKGIELIKHNIQHFKKIVNEPNKIEIKNYEK